MVQKKCKNGLVWDKIQKYCRVPKKRGPKKLSAGDGEFFDDDEFYNAAASEQLGLTISNPNKALSEETLSKSNSNKKNQKKTRVVYR